MMALIPGIVDARMKQRGYAKEWGMRGYIKECGTCTIIDCREWQREQWGNERWQSGAEARRRKREQSVEERREWCRRRTCRRRMLAEDVDAPGPTSSGGAEAEAGAAQPHEAENEAVPCRICNLMLNGPQQYRDHLKSQKAP